MPSRAGATDLGPAIRRFRLTLPLLLMVAVSLVAPVARQVPAAFGAGTGANIDVYRGLGSWVDIYDGSSWADPRGTVEAMKSHGVRTLYLETSNYNRTTAFVFPVKVQQFVDAAHEFGINIVAWYLPGFDNLNRDFRRSMAAIQYTTPAGNSFDSFGLDIESSQVASPSLRTARLLDLSSRIRTAAGDAYPLGAIVPSPKGMRLHPTYWPGFPFQELAATYDVFLPMTYYTWRVSGLKGTHDYTAANVDLIRQQTGDPSVPIHVIGGIADAATSAETTGFVEAVRERGVIGASYYTFRLIHPDQWPELDTIPANPNETPALPVPLKYPGALGNIPGSDQTHPKEVFYRALAKAGSFNLTFRAFDVQAGEVEIWVNWQDLGAVPATADGTWGDPTTVPVPAGWLSSTGPNLISFVAQGAAPNWSEWGVQSVALVPVPA